MTETRRRQFELKPAVVERSVFPYVLQGRDMPEVLREVENVIDSEFKGNDKLKVLRLVRDEGGEKRLVGSNPLIQPVIYRVLPQFRAARGQKK